MKYIILGGGLAGISLAYFLQNNKNISEILIIEKEEKLGGLCRSFEINKIKYDIGPHIIFSKNKEVLELMTNILEKNIRQHKRSNQIIHKNKLIQYPFENDLSKLDREDILYCVNTFMNNPYENYPPENMLQFFLKTFGEGITNLYLSPYNEKIWKYSPAFMDTQMVERIPKPSKEDIIRSANGETIDGYLHQLYFSYPKTGGIEALIQAFISKFNKKIKYVNNSEVLKINKENNKFVIKTNNGTYNADKVFSTIPLNELVDKYERLTLPQEVKIASKSLKYNSLILCIVNVKNNKMPNHYAYMTADKNVIFHRISKIDFMGEEYSIPDSTTYMAEITYRENDIYDKMEKEKLIDMITKGLININFIKTATDINFCEIKKFKYAYVIYDILHKKNVDLIKQYFKQENVYLNGRFGTFEYLNMDTVISNSKKLADYISQSN